MVLMLPGELRIKPPSSHRFGIYKNYVMKLRIPIIITAILIFFIILIAGLWPFEFKPLNSIRRLQNNDGILLAGNNLIIEENTIFNPVLLSYHNGAGILTLEIKLRPSSATNNRFSSILCFYDNKDPLLFMLAKWKSGLILRRRLLNTSGSYVYHETGISNVLFQDLTRFITVTMDETGATVYFDGKKSAVFPGFIFNPKREDLSNTRIMVGNDPRVSVPWEGEINGLAIYQSALNARDISVHYLKWSSNDYTYLSQENGIIALYPMNEESGQIIRNIITNRNNLIIPKHLVALKKSILSKPWVNFWKDHNFYYDLILNIIGFIPLGFFLQALFISNFRKTKLKYSIFSILIGSCVSLSIELIQVYMPARTSSLTDLICNILGTILGVVIFHKVYNLYLLKTKKPDGSGFSTA